MSCGVAEFELQNLAPVMEARTFASSAYRGLAETSKEEDVMD